MDKDVLKYLNIVFLSSIFSLLINAAQYFKLPDYVDLPEDLEWVLEGHNYSDPTLNEGILSLNEENKALNEHREWPCVEEIVPHDQFISPYLTFLPGTLPVCIPAPIYLDRAPFTGNSAPSLQGFTCNAFPAQHYPVIDFNRLSPVCSPLALKEEKAPGNKKRKRKDEVLASRKKKKDNQKVSKEDEIKDNVKKRVIAEMARRYEVDIEMVCKFPIMKTLLWCALHEKGSWINGDEDLNNGIINVNNMEILLDNIDTYSSKRTISPISREKALKRWFTYPRKEKRPEQFRLTLRPEKKEAYREILRAILTANTCVDKNDDNY